MAGDVLMRTEVICGQGAEGDEELGIPLVQPLSPCCLTICILL